MQMYMKERFLYQLWDCGCRETGISEVDKFDNKVVLLVVSVADWEKKKLWTTVHVKNNSL